MGGSSACINGIEEQSWWTGGQIPMVTLKPLSCAVLSGNKLHLLCMHMDGGGVKETRQEVSCTPVTRHKNVCPMAFSWETEKTEAAQ